MAHIKKESNLPTMRFLKEKRIELGLTQYGMAKLLGLLIGTYAHYESKAQGINLAVLNKIRVKLGWSWEELGKLIEAEIKKRGE